MILMKKNQPIAKVLIKNHKIVEYQEIYDKQALPLGTIGVTKEQERLLLNHWQQSRSVPQDRIQLSKLEHDLGINVAEMFIKSAGISLTDTYWLKNENEMIDWNVVNYHDNGFYPVFAKYYLLGEISKTHSPDYTLDGVMSKFWYSIHGQPYLAKLDKEHHHVLIANEVFYTQLAQIFGILTAQYTYGQTNNDIIYCSSPCFIKDSKSDFISAMQVKHSDFKRTGPALLYYFINNLGFEQEIKQMLTLDCLVHNTDRHERNFGYIRKDEEVQFAPLYDNGYCLGINRDYSNPITDNDMKICQGKRIDILDKYGISLDIDTSYILSELQQTYELFQVPEIDYQRAKEDLEYGFDLFSEYQKQYLIDIEL